MSNPGIVPSQTTVALRIGSAAAFAFAALIGTWALVGPAASQDSTCNNRDDVRHVLEQGFAETPVAVGVISEDAIVELFAEAKGATWTLVVSSADGHACVLAAGTDWQSHSPAAPPALPVLHANSR
jgi:hypothetical protein